MVKRKGNKVMKLKKTCVLGAVLCLWTAAVKAEDKIVVDGSTTVGPIAKAWAEYYMKGHEGVNLTVSESGSGNGAKSLINKACDVASMSRPMKDKELQAAKEAGVDAVAHIIAMDGLAVIVHPANPVAGLTVEQVRDIYTGKIRNWKELGGADAEIVVVSRDTNSGTYEAFEELVMNSEKIAGTAEYVGSNGAVRQRVMTTQAAVGYAGLAFLEGVKPLKINGVEASVETVQEKKYPVARPLYLYTNGTPAEGSHLAKYVYLYESKDGNRIVEDLGYVPVQ